MSASFRSTRVGGAVLLVWNRKLLDELLEHVSCEPSIDENGIEIVENLVGVLRDRLEKDTRIDDRWPALVDGTRETLIKRLKDGISDSISGKKK